jgi:hypothetical protein
MDGLVGGYILRRGLLGNAKMIPFQQQKLMLCCFYEAVKRFGNEVYGLLQTIRNTYVQSERAMFCARNCRHSIDVLRV